MKGNILIILLIMFLIACREQCDYGIEGEIALISQNIPKGEIIRGDSIIQFTIPESNTKSYMNFKWLNNRDAFLVTEIVYSGHRGKDSLVKSLEKSNLVVMNKSGKIFQHLHISNRFQKVYNVFPSKNDSYVLFFINKYDSSRIVINEPNEEIFLKIMNLKTNIISSFEMKFTKRTLNVCESPWSPDETSFVFSYTSSRPESFYSSELIQETDGIKDFNNGIYTFNIDTKDLEFITNEGRNAIWSPVSDDIAFIKENKLSLYNTKNHNISIIYEPKNYERIVYIHWTPDGKFIYLASLTEYFGEKIFTFYDEKIVDIYNENNIYKCKIHKGFKELTWK